jgi:flagellar hook-associated protein 2
MTTSLSFGGLASGLDTTAIINALVGAEAIPIKFEEEKQEAAEKKLSLISSLQALVATVQEKADAMKSLTGFLSHLVTPSQEGYANFTVTGTPISGSHTLEVIGLAASERRATVGVADASVALDGGTISFTYNGTAHSIAIDPASSSLNEIADAINGDAAASEDVSASVVNTGTEANPSYQLVLAGNDTGEDFGITGLAITGALGANLSFDPIALSTASNGVAKIDGLTVNRSGNDFSDVVPGITIDAIAVTTEPITFGVTVDQEAIKKSLEEFVQAYNSVSSFIEIQNKFSEDEGVGGELFGERILQTVRSRMYNGFIAADPAAVMADTEGYSSLSLVGISIDQNGNLAIDDDKLGEKMSGDIDAFAGFFGDETTGAFSKLSTEMDYLLDSTGDDINGDPLSGLFDIRKDALNSKIADFKDRIIDMNYRLDKFEESQVTKFAALEVLMAKLQVQGSAVDNLSALGFNQ